MTTHIENEPHDKLLEEKGGGGFPTILILDADGNMIGRHVGERTVAEFDKRVAKAVAYLAAKKKAADGDKSAGIDVAIADLELGTVTAEEAKKKIAALGPPTPEQQAQLDGVLVNAEVTAVMTAAGKDKIAAGKKFAEMKTAGRIPSGYKETDTFYSRILDYAESEKDAKLFEEALGKLKEKFASNPNTKKFFEGKDAILQKLKSGK
ncbi:MAG: hypothetical protein K8T20_08540 [Planctomycetes bacterium]|nr:hypothetical protein [Planctomycetota bacterium]